VKRQTAQGLLWWLLPWLVARLLIPAGFMPVTATGDVGWVLCSVAAAASEADSHANPSRNSGGLHNDVLCPFAAVGSLVPPPLPSLVAARSLASAGLSIPAVAVRPASAGAVRVHWARGPPVLS
jgi:hypothetical protein